MSNLIRTDQKYVLTATLVTFAAYALSIYAYKYSQLYDDATSIFSLDATVCAGFILLCGSLQRQWLPVEGSPNSKKTGIVPFDSIDRETILGSFLDICSVLAKYIAVERLGAERCIALLIPIDGLSRAHRGGFLNRYASQFTAATVTVAFGIFADYVAAAAEYNAYASITIGYIAIATSIALTGLSMQQSRPSSDEQRQLAGMLLLGFAVCASASGYLRWHGQLIPQAITVIAGIFADSWSVTQPKAISTAVRICWPTIMTLSGFLSLNLLHSMTPLQVGSLILLYFPLAHCVRGTGIANSAQSAANVVPSRFTAIESGRYYINEIMREKESRDIFYFLLLNLSFMIIQMVYGIWTNSLGLISDSIHMFFDCLALAVGLIAAVMSKWPASRSHPFGFAKVEIISGFANGIFLVLISFSILIEAIERLMEPPEMTTDQLLLISTLGLGVNLVGIFAFNHGHHHGHSHGHSHTRNHKDDSAAPPTPLPTIHTPRADRHESTFENPNGLMSPFPDFSNFAGFDQPYINGINVDGLSKCQDISKNCLSASFMIPSERGKSPSRSRSPVRRPGSPLKATREPLLSDVAEQHESLSPRQEGRVAHDAHNQVHTDQYNDAHNVSRDHDHDHGYRHDHDHNHDHGHKASNMLLSPIIMHAAEPSYHAQAEHSHDGHHHNRTFSLVYSNLMLTEVDNHDHSHNMEGIFLHILADTLGSAGVIVSTLLIRIFGWTGFDPLASIFIAVLIFLSVIPLLKSSFRDLLLTLQNDQEYVLREVLGEISLISGVSGIPFIRFWVDGSQRMHGILTICAGIDGDTDIVRQKVKRKLLDGVPELVDIIVQVDRAGSQE